MITYHIESVHDCLDEIKPLTHDHYCEIATFTEVKIYSPNWEKYKQLESCGMLRIVTARDGPTLVGYFICIVTPHLHYQGTIFAMNDVVYVCPDYRGTTVAYRMIKFAMVDLKEAMDVNILIIHMKTEYAFRNLLEKLDFKLTEENWERVL